MSDSVIEIPRGPELPRPFGIYRSLSPESAAVVMTALAEARFDVDEYLSKHEDCVPGVFLPREAWGLTYLSKGKVAQGLARGLLTGGTAYKNLQEGLARQAEDTEKIEVPIKKLRWEGPGKRFMRVPINSANGPAASAQLDHDTACFIPYFSVIGAGDIGITRPSHLTVGSLFQMAGLENAKMPVYARKETARIVIWHLRQKGIAELYVDKARVTDENGYIAPSAESLAKAA